MFKLLCSCAHFTCQQDNAQSPSTQTSTVCKLRTSRHTTGFRKGRETRDQIANIHWIMEKAREFQKKSTSTSLTTLKPLCHNKLCKILQEIGIPDHLTCLLRNLYAGQKATGRTEHGTTDWLNLERNTSRLYIISLLI